jgi:hypothetical protein
MIFPSSSAAPFTYVKVALSPFGAAACSSARATLGHETSSANAVKPAAKLIRNEYDLVLCDSKRVAGNMHGGHVARWIQKMRMELPVLFLDKPVYLGPLMELIRRHIPAVVHAAPPRAPSEARG